jgi:hypothetical protein
MRRPPRCACPDAIRGCRLDAAPGWTVCRACLDRGCPRGPRDEPEAHEVRIHPAIRRVLPTVAPGVVASTGTDGPLTTVLLVAAVEPGSGDVGRWLDSLAGPARVEQVVSGRLAGMLLRRGFLPDGDAYYRG